MGRGRARGNRTTERPVAQKGGRRQREERVGQRRGFDLRPSCRGGGGSGKCGGEGGLATWTEAAQHGGGEVGWCRDEGGNGRGEERERGEMGLLAC